MDQRRSTEWESKLAHQGLLDTLYIVMVFLNYFGATGLSHSWRHSSPLLTKGLECHWILPVDEKTS